MTDQNKSETPEQSQTEPQAIYEMPPENCDVDKTDGSDGPSDASASENEDAPETPSSLAQVAAAEKPAEQMSLDEIVRELCVRISESPEMIYRCGKLLQAAKVQLKSQKKNYLPWLKKQKGLPKERMANRFVAATEFVDSWATKKKRTVPDILSDLEVLKSDVIYLLSGENAPEEVVEQTMAELKKRQFLTKEQVKKLKTALKPSKEAAPPTHDTVIKRFDSLQKSLTEILKQAQSLDQAPEEQKDLVAKLGDLEQFCAQIKKVFEVPEPTPKDTDGETTEDTMFGMMDKVTKAALASAIKQTQPVRGTRQFSGNSKGNKPAKKSERKNGKK